MTIVLIFVTSFILNLIWENLHSRLYTHHLGRQITQKILLIATLGDAVMLSVIGYAFMYSTYLHERMWLVIPIGLILAIIIEKYALFTKRWNYKETMPIIPIINVGLTPTIQLAITGYIVLRLYV